MVQRRVKPYTKEFREEVLKLVESSDKPISEIERELGLSPGLIIKWRERYVSDKHKPPLSAEAPPTKDRTLQEVEAENRRLRREIETLRQEREILKKAIGVFSKDQHG
jgi:transposase